MEASQTVFVLVHDAWQGSWVWQDLIERLAERQWTAVALDLPGHGSEIAAKPAGEVSLEDYRRAVVEFSQAAITRYQAKNLILVGHGTAGAIIEMAAEQLAGAVSALIFAGAYILQDGENLASQMPSAMADLFQNLAENHPQNCVDLNQITDFWQYNIINDEPRRAAELLARMVPEPAAPLFEKIELKTFFQHRPACAYISFNEDMSLPPGELYPRMANKIGKHRHMTVNAGHEGIITRPREMAEALIFLATIGLVVDK